MTLRRILLGVAAAAAVSSASAQERAATMVTANEAHEVSSSALTLPASEDGVAVYATCGGCPAKSFAATAATKYYLQGTSVSLADFRAAILGRPNLTLTAKHSVRSGALVSISASVAPTSAAAQRRAP